MNKTVSMIIIKITYDKNQRDKKVLQLLVLKTTFV